MIKKKSKYNNLVIGFITGTLLPVLIAVIVVYIQSKNISFKEYFSKLIQFGLLADILRVTVLTDLILFYVFLNKKFYKSAKGVMLAALVIGFYVIYIKFIA